MSNLNQLIKGANFYWKQGLEIVIVVNSLAES
jgi:hypothetical protein